MARAVPLKAVVAGALVATIATMYGCAGVELSSADRAQTTTIKILANDRMPEEMFFHGKAQSAAGAFGVVGALAGMAMASSPKAQILEKMKEHNIQLPMILQAEFGKAMQSQQDFRIVDETSSADTDMLLTVNGYGLGQSHGFSKLYPILNVSASLRKPDGRVIWQKTDYVTALNKENNHGYEFDEYMEKPELLRETWSVACSIVSRMLVSELSRPR